MNKIVCYGVRDYEISCFEELAKKYEYELELKPQFLTNDNYQDAYGYEIVMVRGNCFLNKESIHQLKDHGCKYLLTRTAGYNHIDIDACKKEGIEVAYVPGYSPNAIAELAVGFAFSLLRNITYTVDRTSKKNFIVTSQMFSKEIRSCTIGILGCGRIGLTAAKLFKGLGAKVIGFDLYQTEAGKEVLEYVDLDTLIKESDIISVHLAYKKGINDDFIDQTFVSKMKQDAILINTSRGEVMDYEAVLNAVENGKISGLACDVVKEELDLFFKDYENKELKNPIHQKMIDLYPKVLITPHIASATNLALKDMVEITLQNMNEYLEKGTCKNSLTC